MKKAILLLTVMFSGLITTTQAQSLLIITHGNMFERAAIAGISGFIVMFIFTVIFGEKKKK